MQSGRKERIARTLSTILAMGFLAAPLQTVHAATLPPPPPPPTLGVPDAGVCTVSATATYSPPVTVIPQSLSITTISGSGTCFDSFLINSLQSFSFGSGSALLVSCGSGLATGLPGSLNFQFGIPAPLAATATYAGGPGTIHLTIAGNGFAATMDLAWTNATSCALGGTATATLVGTMVFAYL